MLFKEPRFVWIILSRIGNTIRSLILCFTLNQPGNVKLISIQHNTTDPYKVCRPAPVMLIRPLILSFFRCLTAFIQLNTAPISSSNNLAAKFHSISAKSKHSHFVDDTMARAAGGGCFLVLPVAACPQQKESWIPINLFPIRRICCQCHCEQST